MNFNIEIPKKVEYILNMLNTCGYESYIVGGCVRDSLLGLKPKDWDITTNATPHDVIAVFMDSGYTIIPTGVNYGTVTLLINRVGYEITTYRKDGTYGDGRRPDKVEFGNSLNEDLERRDFTINAMAYNHTDGLIDLFNGVKDLEDKVLRTVGNPYDRFNEDGLRILRAFRFAYKYNLDIEVETYVASKVCKDNLDNVSVERIREELLQIICHMKDISQDLAFRHILFKVIPELIPCEECGQNQYHLFNVLEHITRAMMAEEKGDKINRMALLLHDIGKPIMKTTDEDGNVHFYQHPKKSHELAEVILDRLKFDNYSKNKILTLVLYHDYMCAETKASVKRFINRIGENLFYNFCEIRRCDMSAHNISYLPKNKENLEKIIELYEIIKVEKECFSIKDLAVNGHDMMSLLLQGKEIKVALNKCLQYVINNPECNNKNKLIEYYKTQLKENEDE